MDRNAVLAKTAKGTEEIRSRAHGLSQKLRALLIMVDGQVTAGALIGKFGGLPEIAAALDDLMRDGYIEAKAVPAAPAPEVPKQTRAEALAALTRTLLDQLGPDADSLTGALERARARADFLAAAEQGARALTTVRGAARAEAFRERATAFANAFFPG